MCVCVYVCTHVIGHPIWHGKLGRPFLLENLDDLAPCTPHPLPLLLLRCIPWSVLRATWMLEHVKNKSTLRNLIKKLPQNFRIIPRACQTTPRASQTAPILQTLSSIIPAMTTQFQSLPQLSLHRPGLNSVPLEP